MKELLEQLWIDIVCLTLLPEFIWRYVFHDNYDFSTYSEYFQNVQDYLCEIAWKNYKK